MKSKKYPRETLYYVQTNFGVALRSAKTMEEARSNEILSVGSSHFQSIREATKEDIEWVKGMGGKVDV